jgi:ribosomal protein S13
MTTYLRNKAKESGLTEDEYIDTLEQMEVARAQELEQQELEEMIESGVAEHIARKVIDTAKVAKELKAEKLKLQEQHKLDESRAMKEAENNAFLEAYPDINIKDIPKEVFKEAEKSNLLTAYTRYQNAQLAKEIEILKQNKTNDKTSPVKGTTEHGGVVVAKEDPFLKGFGIE